MGKYNMRRFSVFSLGKPGRSFRYGRWHHGE